MYKLIILLIVTGIAALCDVKEKKIPNWVTFPGMFIGLFLSGDFNEVLWKVIGLILIFFFGMLGLMGLGDIKLWMATCALTGFLQSCAIVIVAEILFLVAGYVRNRQETHNLFKLTLFDMFYSKKVNFVEQNAYAFAPYMFISSIAYCIFSIVR